MTKRNWGQSTHQYSITPTIPQAYTVPEMESRVMQGRPKELGDSWFLYVEWELEISVACWKNILSWLIKILQARNKRSYEIRLFRIQPTLSEFSLKCTCSIFTLFLFFLKNNFEIWTSDYCCSVFLSLALCSQLSCFLRKYDINSAFGLLPST